MRALRTIPIALLLLMLGAVSPATGADEPALFRDATAELGVDFRHRHFGVGEKRMRENMGAGVAIVDLDGDDRLDLYFVQGADADHGEVGNALFLQTPTGHFIRAENSGSEDRGYGMGVAWGDYDGDGDPDLYVSNVGRNTLLRNRGDATFEDVTEAAGVGDRAWGASTGFFDADGDGDLDLYVVNYLTVEEEVWCGNSQNRVRSYCHPALYEGAPDVLYRNNGDGTFTDVSVEAGIDRGTEGKGLGLAFSNLDGDPNHTLDILVANDSTANHLYLSSGEWRFSEAGLLAGVALNAGGKPESSMGIALDDFDLDGLPDVFFTHLDEETNTLYTAQPEGFFVDTTDASGLGPPSRPWVGFGTVAIDADLDGDLDLLVANGHIIDNIDLFDARRRHAQPLQLFENDGRGRFSEISNRLPPLGDLVGRGMARGDLDRDGDDDVVITQNDGSAIVLLGEPPTGSRNLVVKLRGPSGNPTAFGSSVTLREADGAAWSRNLHSASSYLSQGSADLIFGLPAETGPLTIEVHWPDGTSEAWSDLQPAGLLTLTQGSGQRGADRSP